MSRCRLAVSNETILATRQEFLFTKVAKQSIADIALLDFWIMLLSWMFNSSYTTIYFFVKILVFSNVYISVNTIFKYRSVLSKRIFTHTVSYWSRNHEIVESKTRDYHQKPNGRLALRITKLLKTYDLRKYENFNALYFIF